MQTSLLSNISDRAFASLFSATSAKAIRAALAVRNHARLEISRRTPVAKSSVFGA